MMLNMYMLWYMFFMGLIVFCSLRKHLLLTLLSLEFLVILIFFSLFIFVSIYSNEFYFLIIFLTFAVCEGVMGLSILVSMIRCHGNDNLMNITCLMW